MGNLLDTTPNLNFLLLGPDNVGKKTFLSKLSMSQGHLKNKFEMQLHFSTHVIQALNKGLESKPSSTLIPYQIDNGGREGIDIKSTLLNPIRKYAGTILMLNATCSLNDVSTILDSFIETHLSNKNSNHISASPLLVILNMYDKDEEKIKAEQVSKLITEKQPSISQYYVQLASCITGDGIHEGFDWLLGINFKEIRTQQAKH